MDILKKMMRAVASWGLPIAEEYGWGGRRLHQLLPGAGGDHPGLRLDRILTYEAHISLGCMPILLLLVPRSRSRSTCRNSAAARVWAPSGLTEPEAGSDAGGTKTTAVRENGEWVINGSKIYSTNASYAKFVTITAVTESGQGHPEASATSSCPPMPPVSRWTAGFEKDGSPWLEHTPNSTSTTCA